MKDKPRIGCDESWDRIQIFNANYAPSGKLIGDFERPWNAYTPRTGATFATHAEALEWALQEAGKQ